MNKTKINAIEKMMVTEIYEHFNKRHEREKEALKPSAAVQKLVNRGAKLAAELKKLKADVEKLETENRNKSGDDMYLTINFGYSNFDGIDTRPHNMTSYGARYKSRQSDPDHIELSPNTMKEFKAALAKVDDFCLQLTLGEATLDDVRAELAAILK